MLILKGKPLPLHCFLFTIAPALFLFNHNINELSTQFDTLFSRTAILLVLSSIIVFSNNKFFKNGPRLNILYSLFLIWFFSYGNMFELIRSKYFIKGVYFLSGWCSLLLLAWPIHRALKKADLNKINGIMNFISITLLITLSVNSLFFILNNKNNYSVKTELPPTYRISNTKNENKPDVYYIILDSYMRSDILKNWYGYDNSEFINKLEEKGFIVCDSSFSNYSFTGLSMSSSLNMQYINFLADSFGIHSKNTNILSTLIENNKIKQVFGSLGYSYINLGSWANITNMDHSLKDFNLNEFDINLLNLTIFKHVSILFYYKNIRSRVLSTFKLLNEIPNDPKPTFTYAHILCPHPPFVFGPNGEAENILRNITNTQLEKAYLDQVKFINSKTTTLINNIISKSSNCIIILQADHGAGYIFEPTLFKNNYETLSKKFTVSQMSILNAIYATESCKKKIPENLTPVNTFRIILNEYFDQDYQILKNEIYFSTHKKPYKFENVNNILNEK